MSTIDLINIYENQRPEVIFSWKDRYTNAEGWLIANSLKGGACGGGTCMGSDLVVEDLIALAKIMEIKFNITGPNIGGAKSGIKFNPNDNRKNEVLTRWFKAILPYLKEYYGTGGDLNVSASNEIIPILKQFGLLHPQHGIINGHFNYSKKNISQKQVQMAYGMKALATNLNLPIINLITGYGIAKSTKHFYNIYGGTIKNKKIIIQGWGVVGSIAAYFLTMNKAKIIGIINESCGIIKTNGFSHDEITNFIKRGLYDQAPQKLVPFEIINNKIWQLEADIFIPAAKPRLITYKQINSLINNGLELIVSGTNNPFHDDKIFYGSLTNQVDRKISLIPDFIANCGLARYFSYLMQMKPDDLYFREEDIFMDVSNTIKTVILESYKINSTKTNFVATSLELAITKLITKNTEKANLQ